MQDDKAISAAIDKDLAMLSVSERIAVKIHASMLRNAKTRTNTQKSQVSKDKTPAPSAMERLAHTLKIDLKGTYRVFEIDRIISKSHIRDSLVERLQLKEFLAVNKIMVP